MRNRPRDKIRVRERARKRVKERECETEGEQEQRSENKGVSEAHLYTHPPSKDPHPIANTRCHGGGELETRPLALLNE